jgi:peptidyl-prolyl cis-trans isomerase D
MTGTLRSSARNPIGIALMGILTLVFLLLGIGGGGRLPDILNGARPDSVVSAGQHVISASEFRTIFEQQKQRLQQQSNQTYTTDFLVKNGFDQDLINQMSMDQAEAEMLRRAGVRPAPALIDDQIKKIPFAFDRVTGKFSATQFTQFLAAQGLTLRQVQEDFADELAERHFGLAVAANFRMPRAYAAVNAVAALENRDISYFFLDPHIIPPPAPPTDAQLSAFMQAHAAELTRPEMRVITLTHFSAADFAPSMKVDDAQIAKEFDARKDSLNTPESRTVVQIPVKVAADGAKAAAALAKGEAPAAVAKALGVEPIIYADKPQAEIADRKLGVIAFSMKVNQPQGPVQGDLGLAVLEVTKVTPAKPASLESARPKIEADLRQKAAQDKAYALSEAFDQARQGGATVAAAALKAGAPVVTLGPFTATGLGEDGKPIPGLNDKIVKAVFATSAGEDSDISDAGPGDYFAFHVNRVVAPSLPPLDQARAKLSQAYMADAVRTAFRAKAEKLEADIRAGKSVDAVAASVGAHSTHLTNVQLIKAQQYQSLGRDFLNAVFAVKAGETFASSAPGGAFVGRLDAVRPGAAATTAAVTDIVRGRLSQDYLRDLMDTAKRASETEVAVKTNLKLARQTLGVDPDVATAGAPAKAANKGAGKAQ